MKLAGLANDETPPLEKGFVAALKSFAKALPAEEMTFPVLACLLTRTAMIANPTMAVATAVTDAMS